MQYRTESPRAKARSPLAALLCKALLAASVLALTPAFAAPEAPAAKEVKQAKADAGARKKADAKKAGAKKKAGSKDKKATAGKKAGKKAATAKKKEPVEQKPGPLADFGKESAPAEVVHVANWVSYTRDSKKKAFVVIDKKNARMYVFDRSGKLKSHAPILLGKGVGDRVDPSSLNKPLSQLTDDQKTTPAGRFLALPGKNNHGEDIIWIDYHSAVSMHRMRKVAEEERRAERMASPEIDDNRISNGCVNVPHKFYNAVLKPTVTKQGAYVYVLPETKTPQQLFGSYDVPRNKA